MSRLIDLHRVPA